MAEKYKVKHRKSGVTSEFTSREWDLIQKNKEVAKNYVVVSSPSVTVAKPSKNTNPE
ncbi:hypothetical protein GCM10011418_32770 [Sphingobacterium alkalisoli]|uniref:hypothetical protein n=1 Tax=Sphingobacterium alkalisoli TaxID=1874115 RepID=UPI00145FA952|nr:hypothetical protein [Sphingobacterium alkalisoli]GGH24683.1 hypothetical protein GCM10011418_32770 [Sphingobacterium alkalisoli]